MQKHLSHLIYSSIHFQQHLSPCRNLQSIFLITLPAFLFFAGSPSPEPQGPGSYPRLSLLRALFPASFICASLFAFFKIIFSKEVSNSLIFFPLSYCFDLHQDVLLWFLHPS